MTVFHRTPPVHRAARRRGRCRAPSSNLLVVNGALYLIDAGGSVTPRVVQSGHDFRKIGKIFITHPHSE
jgi:ribonuclease BN (tRNA processing enzyme)